MLLLVSFEDTGKLDESDIEIETNEIVSSVQNSVYNNVNVGQNHYLRVPTEYRFIKIINNSRPVHSNIKIKFHTIDERKLKIQKYTEHYYVRKLFIIMLRLVRYTQIFKYFLLRCNYFGLVQFCILQCSLIVIEYSRTIRH